MKTDTGTKRLFCSMLVMFCILLIGCGGQSEEISAENGEFEEAVEGQKVLAEQANPSQDKITMTDLTSSKEVLLAGIEGYVLGVQYYQGEAVQLRLVDKTLYVWDEDGNMKMMSDPAADIYLDRTDGSSELLFENLSDVPSREDWYIAQDGSIYRLKADYEQNVYFVIKSDPQGERLYERQLEMQVNDLCQLSDGTVVLLLDDGGGLNSRLRVAELDPETGEVTELTQVQLGHENCFLGAGTEGLLVLDRIAGIQEINIRDGSKETLLAFADTSYQMEYGTKDGWIKDIRMTEDGGAELLRSGNQRWILEKLSLTQEEKVPVIMRGFHFNNRWIKNAVAVFNKESDTYRISLEEAPDDWDDFATQTSVQIASGGGPDLLYGEVLSDYIQGMIEKGGFENLTPYLEQSGIQEEDYFPLAFSSWRQGEKIYGVVASLSTYSYSMDSSVLGGSDEEPDIETLVNVLFDYDEKAMYMYSRESGDILELFLEGSEDLFGLIDWESGSCDFSGELFAKMMEVAKRYAYDENQEYPLLASQDDSSNLYSFMAPSMKEKLGRVNVGTLFDDGCYPWVNSAYQILAINANSPHKQGAWEFIAYLLGEKGQEVILKNDENPVNRKAFQKMTEKKLDSLWEEIPVSVGTSHLIKGQYVKEMRDVYKEDITEEWVDAFLQAAEDARPLPIRTKPILAIIREEAEDYFNGVKGMEEVIDVIENRVQLYLDEHAG